MNTNDTKYLALSPQSALDRQIEAAPQFDKYFDKADGKRKVYNNIKLARETVFLMIKIIKETKHQTAKIAQYLKADTLEQTLENIWNFCYKYIKYQKDIDEELRTPSAVWRDGNVYARLYPNMIREDGVQYGVDCDCYTNFISSILLNLDIIFNIKMTSYWDNLGRDTGFMHVYVIVPQSNNQYITVDPVVHQFNYEKPVNKFEIFSLNKFITNMSEVVILSGFGNNQPSAAPSFNENLVNLIVGKSFEGLELGDIQTDNILDYLKQTRLAVLSNPAMLAQTQTPSEFVKMIDILILNWNDTHKRTVLIDQFANIEKTYKPGNEGFFETLKNLVNQGGLNGFGKVDKEAKKAKKEAKKEAKQEKREEKKEAKQEKREEKKEAKQEKREEKKEEKAAKKEEKQEKKEDKKAENEDKTNKEKAGEVLNKLNHFNPVTAGVRNAYALLIAYNFMGMATVLSNTENLPDVAEVRKKVENLYFGLGGKKESLDKAIEKGAKRKAIFNKDEKIELQEDKDLEGFGNLGILFATAGAAATIPVGTTVGWIAKLKKGIDKTKTVIKKGKNITDKAKKANDIINQGKDFANSVKPKKQQDNTSTNVPDTNASANTSTNVPDIYASANPPDMSASAGGTATDDTNKDNEKSLLRIIGKSMYEHSLLYALGGTVVVGGILLTIPKVRQFVGISPQKNKELPQQNKELPQEKQQQTTKLQSIPLS